jgi:hypothetical protein
MFRKQRNGAPQQLIRLDSEKKARQELRFIAYALNDLDFVKSA